MDENSLYDWLSPRDMSKAVSALGDNLGNLAMRRAGATFREAFVASQFAMDRGARAVRLLRPARYATPDFAIIVGDVEKWYETTEADRPGRRRMDEYADGLALGAVERIPDEHWVEPEDYRVLIRTLAMHKAAKAYERCDGLIIWSNAFPIAREHLLDQSWWREAAEPAQSAFAEIWYHFKGDFCRAF